MRRTISSFLFAVVATLAAWCSSPGKAVAEDSPAASPPRNQMNVPYMTVGDETLHLDIMSPPFGNGPFPAVLCVHGGGWRGGNKESMHGVMQGLTRLGFVAVSVQYQFAPKVQFPAQIQQVKAAIRYLRGHAKELRIDPNKIGAFGASAGGHLVLLAGTSDADTFEQLGENTDQSEELQAVISLAGPTDLMGDYAASLKPVLEGFVGPPRQEAPDAYRKASPITYVSPGDPPVLLVHGAKDEIVPYNQAPPFIEACKKNGIEAKLITIPNGTHSGGATKEEEMEFILAGTEFFLRHLYGKESKRTGTPEPKTKQ